MKREDSSSSVALPGARDAKSSVEGSSRFLATSQISHTGRSEWWLFEYDLSRPRMPEAEDPRARFAVKRLVGVYPAMKALNSALSEPQ